MVTFNKDEASTSEEARQYANEVLADDNSFAGEGGRFSSPLADWFVIGGRWSGELSLARLDQDTVKQANDEFERSYGWWLGGKEHMAQQQRLEQYTQVFLHYFPDYTGNIPYWRDPYSDFGADDDAQIVDDILYERLLKGYEGSDGDNEYFVDLDWDMVKRESFVGKKWIVVVDYHM